MVEPGPRHLEILHALLRKTGIVGSSTADVVLAAIALEHDGTVVSADAGFAQFQPPSAG